MDSHEVAIFLLGALFGFGLCVLTLFRSGNVTAEQMSKAVETCSSNGGVKALYLDEFVCANGLKGEY